MRKKGKSKKRKGKQGKGQGGDEKKEGQKLLIDTILSDVRSRHSPGRLPHTQDLGPLSSNIVYYVKYPEVVILNRALWGEREGEVSLRRTGGRGRIGKDEIKAGGRKGAIQ